jgi:hypothetical protein
VLDEQFDPVTGVDTVKSRFDFADGSVFGTARVKPGAFEVDSFSCLETGSGTVQARVTGGTGRYRHARGRLRGTVRTWGLTGRNPDGSCSQSQTDERFHDQVVKIQGTVSLEP